MRSPRMGLFRQEITLSFTGGNQKRNAPSNGTDGPSVAVAIPSFSLAFQGFLRYRFHQGGEFSMKRLLPGLATVSMIALLSMGCATSSTGGSKSANTTTNPSVAQPTATASPNGEVYTPAVAAPQTNP